MTSPTPEERIISPDDEDWDWRAGHKLLKELTVRCRCIARRDGQLITDYDSYDYEFYFDDYRVWVGTVGLAEDETRIRIDAGFGNTDRRTVYASHAQVEPLWKEIQTKTLPLLGRLMVLDDLAGI